MYSVIFVQALAAAGNLTAHDDSALRFIATGGADVLVSVLSPCSSPETTIEYYRSPDSGFSIASSAANIVCNLSPNHATSLVVAGIIRPILKTLSMALQIRGSLISVLAEPLCWSLEIMAQERRNRPFLIEAGAFFVLEVAWKLRRKGISGHARHALLLLDDSRKSEFEPSHARSNRIAISVDGAPGTIISRGRRLSRA